MLRVSPGHYRDVFRRKVYDVFRARDPRDGQGWRYQLNGGLWSPVYETKMLAEQAARREIDRSLQEITTTLLAAHRAGHISTEQLGEALHAAAKAHGCHD